MGLKPRMQVLYFQRQILNKIMRIIRSLKGVFFTLQRKREGKRKNTPWRILPEELHETGLEEVGRIFQKSSSMGRAALTNQVQNENMGSFV